MRRRDTPFPHNCPLLPLHPCYVTKPVQQLPEPATLPWREITEIGWFGWLLRWRPSWSSNTAVATEYLWITVKLFTYLYFLWYRFQLYSAWLVAQRTVSDVLVFVIFFLFCVGRCITVWICSYSCCVVVFVLCVFPVSRGGKFAPDDDCYKVETCSVLSMKKYLLTYTKDSCVVCIFLQNTVTVTRHNVAWCSETTTRSKSVAVHQDRYGSEM